MRVATMPGQVLKLGDVVPNFSSDTTHGNIDFHSWIQDSWAILFSHPADYTPVCTTELGRVQMLSNDFAKRGVKLIALSCDEVDSHNGWIKDIIAYNNLTTGFSYPIIADPSREVAKKYGMMDPDEKDAAGIPLTCRAVFVIGPDKRLKLSLLYPATTGRNFDEILRVVDSLQLTATRKVATPVDWKQGGSVMVVPGVKQEQTGQLFPKGVTVHSVPSGVSANNSPARVSGNHAKVGCRKLITLPVRPSDIQVNHFSRMRVLTHLETG